MLNYKILEQKVSSAPWSKEQKNLMTGLSSKLGVRLLDFISRFVDRPLSQLDVDEVIKTAQVIVHWYTMIEKNASNKVVSELITLMREGNYWAEQTMFYGIMDIQANTAISKSITPELSRLFNLLECIYFEQLLNKEVVQLLKNSAVSVASFADLSEEVKRYQFIRDLSESQIQQFRLSLEQNIEEIGTEPLSLLSGAVRPTLGNWLKAFAETRSQTAIKGSYNVAYFVTNHPAAIKLTQNEKAALADLLRLYTWLLKPELYPNEIFQYADERKDYYRSVKQDLIALSQSETQSTHSTPKLDSAAPMSKPAQNRSVELGGVALDTKTNKGNKTQGAPFQVPDQLSELDQELAAGRSEVVLGGLAVNEGTNIKIDMESKRLQEQRNSKLQSIQSKLEELRKRNNIN